MAQIELRKLASDGTVSMTYLIKNFSTFGFMINTPVTPTPLPEEDSSENVLVKVEGNSTPITLSWTLKDEPENVITGTSFVGNSATVIEQILGIKNQFRAVSIDDAYQIALVENSIDLITWNGTETKIGANFQSASPVAASGRFEFMEGNVVTNYNSDGPKQPTNVVAVPGGSSGEIDLSWDNPADTGTGNPSLTGYRIQYRTGNTDWTTEDFTPSATSETIDSLTSSATYLIRVAATTADGVGEFSAIRTADAT